MARSGTTLLRLMLDAHPELAIPPETHFIPKLAKALGEVPKSVGEDELRRRAHELITQHRRWPDFGLDADELDRRFDHAQPFNATTALRAFYGLYAEKRGKPRWGDKSPSYVRRMRRVHAVLPEARFVHVIRDGRDTLAAKPGEIDVGSALATGQRWHKKVRSARVQEHMMDHYLEVRYEELVADTEATLRTVCEFLDLGYEPAMLTPADRAPIEAELGPVGGWRERLAPDQLEAFEEVGGEMLAELGYAREPAVAS